ncbi:hypothetical protein EV202_12447 [Bacteroides heparinolyticus]|uniref:Uncharacterized protein n=1 Tax=Prevotella heparinolytica TaxID=28113 RepID=A0A4V2SEB4_9BACE|nr:hypothetical protein EV202_12447 [Bacteroides heparinolyticus]
MGVIYFSNSHPFLISIKKVALISIFVTSKNVQIQKKNT